MPNKQHTVDLSEDERVEPESFVSNDVRKAEDITRARILLKADDGAADGEISRAFDCSMSTPYRARKRYAERGIAAVHRRNPDRDYERKLTGDEEARLIKLVCNEPPEGYSQWSLRLLADELVVLEAIDHESISHETVHQVQKTPASLHRTMGNSTRRRRRVRLPHGRRPRALPRTVRSEPACCLFRRTPDRIDRGSLGLPCRLRRAGSLAKTISTASTERRTCFWRPNRSPAGER